MLTYEELLDRLSNALNKEQFTGRPAELYKPIAYMMQLGGKRLRPVLLLMACDAWGGNIEEAMPAALCVEVFHNFTLVHDDIMDNAIMRRGKDTIWNIWGEDTAILAGDTMFTLAIDYLLRTGNSKLDSLLHEFTGAARKVCEGQQYDMNFETEEQVSIPDYLNMIRLKTSALIGTSLKMGAMIGNAGEEDLTNIYAFGENIGMAFQLKDDLLDVFGNVDKFGKMPGGDILSDKKTFLLLKALSIGSSKDKKVIYGYMDDNQGDPEQKIMDITAIYKKLNIDKITTTEMERYYERAKYHLQQLKLPEENKAELISIAKKMMYREN
jgi:geranylgeranyl diphosphate synthase, type II